MENGIRTPVAPTAPGTNLPMISPADGTTPAIGDVPGDVIDVVAVQPERLTGDALLCDAHVPAEIAKPGRPLGQAELERPGRRHHEVPEVQSWKRAVAHGEGAGTGQCDPGITPQRGRQSEIHVERASDPGRAEAKDACQLRYVDRARAYRPGHGKGGGGIIERDRALEGAAVGGQRVRVGSNRVRVDAEPAPDPIRLDGRENEFVDSDLAARNQSPRFGRARHGGAAAYARKTLPIGAIRSRPDSLSGAVRTRFDHVGPANRKDEPVAVFTAGRVSGTGAG